MNHGKKNESEKVFQVAQVPLGAEHGEKRVEHQRHKMSSEGRPKKCKYWNLPAVVMSDCSLIATRNLHAKHNKLVCHVGYTELSTEKGEEEEFSAYTKDFSIFLPPEAKKNHNQRTHQIRLQIKKLVRKRN